MRVDTTSIPMFRLAVFALVVGSTGFSTISGAQARTDTAAVEAAVAEHLRANHLKRDRVLLRHDEGPGLHVLPGGRSRTRIDAIVRALGGDVLLCAVHERCPTGATASLALPRIEIANDSARVVIVVGRDGEREVYILSLIRKATGWQVASARLNSIT